MKYTAREVVAKSGWLGIALLGLVLMVGVVLADTKDQILAEATTSFIPPIPKTELASYTAKKGYGVVGRVEAKKEIIIRAKQAGTIEEVLVTEGSLMETGQMLALQLDPVLSARLSRQAVASSIAKSERQSALLANEADASLQEINSFKATGLSALTSGASTNRTLAAEAQLITNLETLIVSLPEILRFVQDNKTYFPSESNVLYREVISQLYGKDVDYLRLNSLAYPTKAEGSLIKSLASLTSSTTPTEMVAVTNRAFLALGTLAKVFTQAENEFLDRNQLSSNETAYTGYNETRQNLLTLKLALEQSIEALDNVSDTGAINVFNNQAAVAESEVVKFRALEQSKIAQVLLDKTEQLAVADRAVLEAELSLGVIRTPFVGVVSEVLVEAGEFVQPGTPLFALVGVEDQEMVVRVPGQFISRVDIGNNFWVADKVVGQVDRIVPVLNGGSAMVFVDLAVPLTIGQSLRGELELANESNNELMISRRYLFFSASGPYVKTSAGREVAVSIVLDEGETLLVVPEQEIKDTLIRATGIRL